MATWPQRAKVGTLGGQIGFHRGMSSYNCPQNLFFCPTPIGGWGLEKLPECWKTDILQQISTIIAIMEKLTLGTIVDGPPTIVPTLFGSLGPHQKGWGLENLILSKKSLKNRDSSIIEQQFSFHLNLSKPITFTNSLLSFAKRLNAFASVCRMRKVQFQTAISRMRKVQIHCRQHYMVGEEKEWQSVWKMLLFVERQYRRSEGIRFSRPLLSWTKRFSLERGLEWICGWDIWPNGGTNRETA